MVILFGCFRRVKRPQWEKTALSSLNGSGLKAFDSRSIRRIPFGAYLHFNRWGAIAIAALAFLVLRRYSLKI
jgi:hypothetical protein